MKKLFFTISLILTMLQPLQASIEGRIFLELTPEPNNKQNMSTSLNELYQKNIGLKNVREAILNIKTNDNILITDLALEQEYSIQKENGVFNITNLLKNNLALRRNNLQINIGSEYCFKNCKANEYPFLRIHYSFNNQPSIDLFKPFDGEVFSSNDVVLKWEGKDSDGKFLEYKVEVSKDRFFNNIVLQTSWSTEKQHNINLEEGNYYWRVSARDNSFLQNLITSHTYGFEIVKGKEMNLDKEVPEKPIILFPLNNTTTNAREIELLAKAETGTKNYILLNNLLLFEIEGIDIKKLIKLEKEGENIIKIISQRGKYSSESSVQIFTKWTPPSTPDFEFKLEDGKVFLKIKNEDYEKAYLYFENDLIKEMSKSKEWTEIGQETEFEMKVGVLLEDELGNQTQIFYKIFTPNEELLGIGGASHNITNTKIPNSSLCVYKYNRTHKKFVRRTCKITKPGIIKIENTTKDHQTYNTNITGIYNPDITVLVDEYQCTLKIICREKFVKRTRLNLSPYTAVNVFINNNFVSPNALTKANKHIFTLYLVGRNNLQNQKATLKYHTLHGFKYDNQWIDFNFVSPGSDAVTIPTVIKLADTNSQKIFNFPFKKNIGVTQWHGYTAYQSPHTGIDFGSYKEPVYAIGNGIIKEAKWDNSFGVCLSGGHYLRIEHSNGMNSVYLHLENYKKSNGKNWAVGESVKKGELIGISGNTGAYNCQPLGYHLHFEIRKDNHQRNHINPVPYISINWDNIPTLQHTKYPGRLTGNNPHPTW